MDEYKNHLEQFFFYMYNNQDMNAKCSHVSEQSSSIYSKLKSVRDGKNWSLSISPPLNIPIENDEDFQDQKGCLLIGGRVEIKQSKFVFHSFSFCIATNDRIVRRFHFDIHTGAIADGKPKCHMQYRGDAQHELKLMAHLSHNLDPWLKKPRFPFPPVDVVLLFDLVLRQVETALGRKFVEEGNWKKLVKESETIAMKGYYRFIHSYFESDSKDTLFEMLSR